MCRGNGGEWGGWGGMGGMGGNDMRKISGCEHCQSEIAAGDKATLHSSKVLKLMRRLWHLGN